MNQLPKIGTILQYRCILPLPVKTIPFKIYGQRHLIYLKCPDAVGDDPRTMMLPKGLGYFPTTYRKSKLWTFVFIKENIVQRDVCLTLSIRFLNSSL